MEPATAPDLCARCASIDFNKILSRGAEGQIVARLGTLGRNCSTSSCSLCRLFASTKQHTSYDYTDSEQFTLVVTQDYRLGKPSLCVLGNSPPRQHLEPARIGHVASTNPPESIEGTEIISGRVIDPFRVDYKVVRQWLDHCQLKHESPCSGRDLPPPDSLKLINCSTRQLETLEMPFSYLALSYVWGQTRLAESSQYSGIDLPNILPRTVEDAITVTKSLGFTYLWVDKYCIDQANEEEMSHQIRQMDRVYLNAELTIVAGAGDNSDAGLPGVRSVSRAQQPQARTGNHLLISWMNRPRAAMTNSPWFSRGWTFQEAVLSRRLLIFTAEQLYFECHYINFQETLGLMGGNRLTNLFFQEDERRGDPSFILERLVIYSRRKLTYQDDILNACRGIFSLYERAEHPVYQHWGVPILPPIICKRGEKPRSVHRSWSDGFVIGLCWQHWEPGPRRVNFPSWSWAGWAVPLSIYAPQYYFGLGTQGPSDIEVFLEDRIGSVIPWDVYWASRDQFSNFSHYIHLSAYIIPIRFQYKPEDLRAPYHYWATPDVNKHPVIGARLSLLQETDEFSHYHRLLMSASFVGVILGESHTLKDSMKTFIMVVYDRGSFYERIGHLFLEEYTVRKYNQTSGTFTHDVRADEEMFRHFFRHQEKKLIRIG